MTDALRPAIFLDKDGTLIEDVPYNVDPRRVRLANGAADAVAMLAAAGYRLVIVTNQSGIARGYFTETELREIESRRTAGSSSLRCVRGCGGSSVRAWAASSSGCPR